MNFKQLLAGLLLAAPVLAYAEEPPTNNGQKPSAQTWRTLAALTTEEKKVVDLRSATPRSSEFPYMPAEMYPFVAPYTAEEVGYRLMNYTHRGRWSHILADSFGTITHTGYLTQGALLAMVNQVGGGHGIAGQLNATPGEVHSLQLFHHVYPPRNNGKQTLWVMRRTGPQYTSKLDNFSYSPSLRRVRRSPAPRREESFPNTVPGYDDVAGRDAWELSWRFIGADVLYETVRFPDNRPKITMTRANGKYYEQATADIRMMGDEYPYYRVDGGIDTFVVVAEPDPEWLPDYGVSKIVYWVDQHYFYPLRTERYDRDGKLKTIEVRVAKRENRALPDWQGYASLLFVHHEVNADLMSYYVHTGHLAREWSEEEQTYFTPDFMRRDWLIYARKSHALIDRPEEFFLRPQLLADHFPAERPIVIAPEVVARSQAQDEAGHLLFSSGE